MPRYYCEKRSNVVRMSAFISGSAVRTIVRVLPQRDRRNIAVRHRFADIAFTPSVQAAQEKYGSRAQCARLQGRAAAPEDMGEAEAEFLARADSFYLASVSETGWPYVQHRGGPRGFLQVVSRHRLAFPDFRGNRQYVSVGNAAHDDRAALIVMDYAQQRRLKVLGRLRFADLADADPELARAVIQRDYPARVERIATIDVEAFDWNCPQHITPRLTLEQIDEAVQPLRARIAELEAEVSRLRSAPAAAL
jgi:predicted pyridoxine 5'-phosphate oxidase superfamily flavin-nucleotide-binding protein